MPWTAARQASLSFPVSRSLLRLRSIEWVMSHMGGGVSPIPRAAQEPGSLWRESQEAGVSLRALRSQGHPCLAHSVLLGDPKAGSAPPRHVAELVLGALGSVAKPLKDTMACLFGGPALSPGSRAPYGSLGPCSSSDLQVTSLLLCCSSSL